MPVNTEKEITTLWRNLHSAQNEICKTYYRWRQAALEIAGPDADPSDVAMKAVYIMGKDIGKGLLPRLNWLKGEEAFMMMLGRTLAGLWAAEGAAVKVEQGERPTEILITCTRDPWPSIAKEYGVPMEEVAVTREKLFQTILEDVSAFFNTNLAIEMQKAIPRGEGMYLFRLYKADN
jgi:hypothetical protein